MSGPGLPTGLFFLDMNGIRTVGTENVHIKNVQASEFFHKLGIIIYEVDEIDFRRSSSVYEADFNC